MTAADHRGPAGEVVADPGSALEVAADPGPAPAGAAERAPAVIARYDAEHQLVGSLMWLSASAARPLLALVPATAIRRPLTRWAFELIGRVVDEARTPTPPVVLAAGRRHRARDALDPAQTTRPAQHHQLALYLFEAYQQAVAPHAAVTTYVREVLDQAYRQAFGACGMRMQELAGCAADRDDLSAEFGVIADELAGLWWRTEAAATLCGA